MTSALLTAPLAGKILLITGAGDGLGRATAIAAAQQGATVVLLGRTIKKLEATYDAIEAAGGPQPAIIPLNLNGAAWLDYQTLAETLTVQLGRIDGLIHCAAHFTGFVRLAELPAKDWMDGLQTNLTAAYILTRSCLHLLEQSNKANVVFVTDSAGSAGKPFHGVYGIAKAALETLSTTWAAESKLTHPNLQFQVFDPGPMRTGLRIKGYAGEGPNDSPPPTAAAERLLALLL